MIRGDLLEMGLWKISGCRDDVNSQPWQHQRPKNQILCHSGIEKFVLSNRKARMGRNWATGGDNQDPGEKSCENEASQSGKRKYRFKEEIREGNKGGSLKLS